MKETLTNTVVLFFHLYTSFSCITSTHVVFYQIVYHSKLLHRAKVSLEQVFEGHAVYLSNPKGCLSMGFKKRSKRRRLRPGALSAGERSYHTSEVRGSSRECQAVTEQERPRGATQVQGQWWLGGDTPHWRSGAAARRSNLRSGG